MRPEFWQGDFSYWQNRFIHHNLLTIGHTAWQGYVNAGRGAVVCEIAGEIPPAIDWSVEIVPFDRSFLPRERVASSSRSLELTEEAVAALSNAIATYDPARAIVIVVLALGNGEIDITLLRNLAISPAECYQQVQQRWAEFTPDSTIQRRY